MKQIIKNNIFVFTRSLTKDYAFVCKPNILNSEELMQLYKDHVYDLHSARDTKYYQHKNIINDWFYAELGKSKQRVVFRVVFDGRKDQYSRSIYRLEGSIMPIISEESIIYLEGCLQEKQRETNNYDYGYKTGAFVEDLKEMEQKESAEIESRDGKFIIKSNVLLDYLKEHTYNDLLSCIQIEPKEEKQIRF